MKCATLGRACIPRPGERHQGLVFLEEDREQATLEIRIQVPGAPWNLHGPQYHQYESFCLFSRWTGGGGGKIEKMPSSRYRYEEISSHHVKPPEFPQEEWVWAPRSQTASDSPPHPYIAIQRMLYALSCLRNRAVSGVCGCNRNHKSQKSHVR